jgi:TRAP-type uncharacterized transport system substrate-binding protein
MMFSQMIQVKASYLGCIATLLAVLPAYADHAVIIPSRQEAAKVNSNSVGIVFTHEELYHQIVHDIEDEVESGSGLRVVPTMGKNHVQSIYDLLFLKGVDFALVRADAIEYVRRYGDFPNIQSLIRSFTKISEEKIVIIARSEINSIDELVGKPVSFGVAGSGEFVTGSIVFDSLGIESQHRELDNADAIEELKSGELKAIIYLLRSADAVQSSADEEAKKRIRNLKKMDGVHVLELPDSDDLKANYRPVALTHDDLPGMIEDEAELASYSVDSILAAYNWASDVPRYKKVVRFAAAFIDNLENLQSGPYQPAWSRVELDSETPNVIRLAVIDNVIADRERKERDLLLAEERRIAAEKEAVQANKIAELVKQREEITSRLGEKMSTADTEELEQLLDQLAKFMQKLESAEPE